ncbi:MAG: sulfotransferase [Pseudomonadota bacterium]
MDRLDPRDYGFSRFSPRMWHGMTFGAWCRLLRGNLRFVTRDRLGVVASVTLLSLGNSVLRGVSDAVYARRLAQVEITPDPVFVLGYWRSGTTWLHQLLATDPRFAAPNGLQVFMPETFLVGRWFIKPLLSLWMPPKRPMDGVEIGHDTSEEDEVALAISGAPSLLRRAVFWGRDVPGSRLLLSDLPAGERTLWATKWDAFLRKVQMVNPGKRILLKSPGHTVRIPDILARFPNAKFIHIARNPYDILRSAEHTIEAMAATQGLSSRRHDPGAVRRERYDDFQQFHEAFHRDLDRVQTGSISFLRYEDLRRDPVGELARVYEELNLGGFDRVEPALRARVAAIKDYAPRARDLDPALEAEIWTEARVYFGRYGYARQPAHAGHAP